MSARVLQAAVVALWPLLLVGNAFGHPEVELTAESYLAAAAADPWKWYAVHLVAASAALLTIPSAVVVRSLVPGRGRRWATAGTVLAVVGGVALVVAFSIEAGVMRVATELDRQAALAVTDEHLASPEAYLVPVGILGTAVGVILLSVALVVGRAVPTWQAVLYGVGAGATLAPASPGTVLGSVGFVLLAVAAFLVAKQVLAGPTSLGTERGRRLPARAPVAS